MRGAWGYVANGISCVYIIVFIVIFCFPYALPVDALSMNYASLITGGLTIFVGLWWLWRGRRGYKGPKAIGVIESFIVDNGASVEKEKV